MIYKKLYIVIILVVKNKNKFVMKVCQKYCSNYVKKFLKILLLNKKVFMVPAAALVAAVALVVEVEVI